MYKQIKTVEPGCVEGTDDFTSKNIWVFMLSMVYCDENYKEWIKKKFLEFASVQKYGRWYNIFNSKQSIKKKRILKSIFVYEIT
jgi:hypothetical protein